MWFISLIYLQVFLTSVEQVDSWLSNKEAFLSNEDLGVRTACYTANVEKISVNL